MGKTIYKWIYGYAAVLSLLFIIFAMLALSGQGYAELPRSGEALHAVVSIAIRYFAVVLILLLGIACRNGSLLFAGFMAGAVITLGDFVASVIITRPPSAQVVVSAVVSTIVIWVPQALCMSALPPLGRRGSRRGEDEDARGAAA